jgi:hydrogenase maturation protease
MTTRKAAVLGVGNLLLGDEGVGVHVARLLRQQSSLDDVEVLDIGTAILDALPVLENCDRVILVDAVKAGGEPGTIYQMPLSEFNEKSVIASMHGFDLHRVMRLVQRSSPPEVIVIGVEPATIDWSLDLSPAVAGALPALESAILGCIAQGAVR